MSAEGSARASSTTVVGWIGGLGSLALLAFAASLLLREPCLGVADNGDWWRVMRPAGIDHESAPKRPGRFVHCELGEIETDLASSLSSPALVARGAKALGWAFGTTLGRFDLRQVGTVYWLFVVGLAAWAFSGGRGSRAPPLLVAGWCYVLVDPGYVLFFNSFYADPALLVALFGIALWFVNAGEESPVSGRGRMLLSGLLLIGLTVLGGGSKMQYVLLPGTVSIAYLSLAWGRPRAVGSGGSHGLRLRGTAVWALAAILIVLSVLLPLHFFHGPAPRFVRVNNYHAVFAGILQATEQPERVLRELDLPAEFVDLPRRDVWSGSVPLDHPVHAALSDLSRVELLSLYAREPAAARAATARVDAALAPKSPHSRGTFTREAGRRRWAQYEVPWQFSRLRTTFGALRPWWVPSCLALVWLGWTACTRSRSWGNREACALFLLLFAGSAIGVAVLGDGFVALDQHLLGTRFALDLLLVLVAHEMVRELARRVRSHRAVVPIHRSQSR